MDENRKDPQGPTAADPLTPRLSPTSVTQTVSLPQQRVEARFQQTGFSNLPSFDASPGKSVVPQVPLPTSLSRLAENLEKAFQPLTKQAEDLGKPLGLLTDVTSAVSESFDGLAKKVRDFGFEQIGKSITDNLDFDDRLLRDGITVGIENAEQRDLLEADLDQVTAETKGDKDALLTAFLATRKTGAKDAESRQALTVISQFIGATGADADQTGTLVGQLIVSGRSLEQITRILAGLERQRAANGSLDTGQVFGILKGLPEELRVALDASPEALLSATALLQALGRNQSAGEAQADFKTLATTFQDVGVRQRLEAEGIDLPEAGQPLDLADLVEQIIQKTGGDSRKIENLIGRDAAEALGPIITDALANGGEARFLASQRAAEGTAATLKDAADRQAEAFGRTLGTMAADFERILDKISEGIIEPATKAFNDLDPATRQTVSTGGVAATVLAGTVALPLLKTLTRRFGGPALEKLITRFTSAAPVAGATSRVAPVAGAASRVAPAAASTSRVAQVTEGLGKAAKAVAATGPGSAAVRAAAPVLTAAKGVSKVLGALATPLTVGFAVFESAQALSDDTLSATQKGERVGAATGGAIGSIAGLALSALAGPFAPLLAVPAVLAGNFIGEQIGGVFGEVIGGALEDEERQARQPAPVQVTNPPEVDSSRFLGTVRLVLSFDQDGLLRLIREQQTVDALGFSIEPELGLPGIDDI